MYNQNNKANNNNNNNVRRIRYTEQNFVLFASLESVYGVNVSPGVCDQEYGDWQYVVTIAIRLEHLIANEWALF